MRRGSRQPDLLDWQPPRPVAGFARAEVREREDELRRQGDALRRQARSGGLL